MLMVDGDAFVTGYLDGRGDPVNDVESLNAAVSD